MGILDKVQGKKTLCGLCNQPVGPTPVRGADETLYCNDACRTQGDRMWTLPCGPAEWATTRSADFESSSSPPHAPLHR